MPEQKRLWMMLSCLTVLLTACGSDGGNNEAGNGVIVENTADLCSDDVDNDKNGLKDCDEPGCKDFAFCAQTAEGKENTLAACRDGEDNDGDGKIDCDDDECKDFAICQEEEAENTLARCQDGRDNDRNGLIDCDDNDCKAFSVCSGSSEKATENTIADCVDGEDNDGDGKIDCEDEGCRFFSFCADAGNDEKNAENTLKACTDGEDNDGDGDIDCLDMDCRQFEVCAPLVGVKENTRELCSDGLDNDYNGDIDCADVSCRLFCMNGGATGEFTVEHCKDGLDNDGDGKADCEDPECAEYDFCMPGYPEDDPAKDECPDDPYKFKKDQCECGQTFMGEDNNGAPDCYENIVEPDDLAGLLKSSKAGKFIIKRDLDFGTTDAQFNVNGFSGTFDGGNHRITGVFYQKGPNCSLFSGTTDNAVFKNLDIAITLNCDNTNTTSQDARVGALFGTFKGIAEHITGSSKVYVEENRSETSMKLETGKRYIKAVGGLIGVLAEGQISDITLNGNVSVYYPLNRYNLPSSSTPYPEMYYEIGGVIGLADHKNTLIKDVWANAFVTVDRYTILNSTTNYAFTYSYMGGVIGSSLGRVDNVHNSGTVMYYPRNSATGVTSAVGGIIGKANQVVNSSFNGSIYVHNGKCSEQWKNTSGESKAYFGLKVGGILGLIDQFEGIGVDNCQVDAEIQSPIYNASIGGIIGTLDSYVNNVYVRNSSAKVDLILRPLQESLSSSYYAYGSYGGIVGTAYRKTDVFNRTAYIINNSASTNYIQLEKVNNFVSSLSMAGICAIQQNGNGGVIVNNFASDRLTCSDVEGCYYTPRAIGGSYVYESYWDETLFGNDPGANDYYDASAEAFTYNAENIPVTRSGNTVLGLLRYNAGHDGGVLSAHIPNDGTYLNWTTSTGNEGHVIPVPESAYIEVDE